MFRCGRGDEGVVDETARVVPGHHVAQQVSVADVAPQEREAARHGRQIGRVTRLGELVQNGHGRCSNPR